MEELELLEKELRRRVNSGEKALTDMALHVINAGGKRIRPRLAILAYKSVGGKNIKELIPLAVAYELIHTATLIHDDINDGSYIRRGIPTLNKLYGEQKSIISGDFLFVKGYETCGHYGEDIVRITADACTKMAEGQIMEIENLYNTDMDEGRYFRIIGRKTAFPMEAGARIGAMLGGGTKNQIRSLSKYGYSIGMAFQIKDDILDVAGDEKVTGKPVGLDIIHGNITLLSIHALRTSRHAGELRSILLNKKKTKKEVRDVVNIIKESGSVEYAQSVAEGFAREAKKYVGKSLKYKKQFESLVDEVVMRGK